MDRGPLIKYGMSTLILLNVGFAAFMTDDDHDGIPDDPLGALGSSTHTHTRDQNFPFLSPNTDRTNAAR